MAHYIAGDVGGTNARLVLVRMNDEEVIDRHDYPSAEYSCFSRIVKDFQTRSSVSVSAACFAVAGPVSRTKSDTTALLTNLDWSLSSTKLSEETGIAKVTIINDFEAVGYGLTHPGLEVLCINPGTANPTGPIACLGAGTGLGEVYLTHNGSHYDAWSSEGGHCDFAPLTALDFELMTYLKQAQMIDRVSTERVVSGSGIPNIYAFLKFKGFSESPTVAKALAVNGMSSAGGTIAKHADSDALCGETMRVFFRYYAAEAGNLALKTLCTGGLYFAGGIAPKSVAHMNTDEFRRVMFAKGRMKGLLEKLPVYIVMDEGVGLLGARVSAKRLLD